jgi:DnaK suppressor protein
MNIEHFKRRLVEEESSLQSNIRSFEGEARVSGEREVRDSVDDANSSEGTSESLLAATSSSRTLMAVRDALQRMKDGAYGKCIACGRRIEAARLEAVPWASYCLADQEKEDKAEHAPQGGSTL